MQTSGATTHICVACNEDGFGPSVFGYYVVRKLVDAWSTASTKLHVTVLNRSAAGFNRRIYEGIPVDFRSVPSLIRLVKEQGEVSVRQTLDSMREYVAQDYVNSVREYLKPCDVAIDIGVPQFTRAAAELGVRHRLTVFDHSWAATLKLIASAKWAGLYRRNPPPNGADRSLAKRMTAQIAGDEACATDVFLFQEYITPVEFVRHWKELGFTPRILGGVLGTRPTKEDARAKLNKTLAQYGEQAEVPPDGRLVAVSPGGTPVWNTILPTLLHQVLEGPERGYILVFTTDLGDLLDRTGLHEQFRTSGRVRYYGPVHGATQLAVLPAFERIITRAGGGTVNDALAAGVPLALVEEPQVQVKLIERECVRFGFCGPAATLDQFEATPMECIDRLVAMPLPNRQIVPAPNAETAIVQRIQELVF